VHDTSPNGPAHGDDVPSFELVESLRDWLRRPVPKPESTEAGELERIVNQLAARYARDKDPELSLNIIATIGLAAKAGNKAAKKVVFDRRRWDTSHPPSLGILRSEDEQLAALKTLASKSAHWLAAYALRTATDPTLSKPVRTQARKVCAKRAGGPAELLDLASQQAAEGSLVDLLASVSLLVPELAKGRVTGFVGALERLTDAVGTRLAAGPRPASDDDIRAAHRLLTTILECLARVDPGALIEAPAMRAIVAIDELRTRTSAKPCRRLGDVLKIVWSVARPVVASPGDALAGDTAARLRWLSGTVPVLEAARTTRPDEDAAKALENAAAPAAPETDEGISHALADAVADLVRILPADAPPTLDVEAIVELRVRIEACARLAGVEAIGVTGEVMAFDPVTQFLDADDTVTPTRVRVAKPGIGARRTNGSLRIIRKPIVKLMED